MARDLVNEVQTSTADGETIVIAQERKRDGECVVVQVRDESLAPDVWDHAHWIFNRDLANALRRLGWTVEEPQT